MSNNVYVIADTHFGHKRIIGLEGRPFATIEDHDEELVRRWNAVVRKKDTVWHLGDVLFGRASFSILSELNGVKKLVMGNHDGYPSALYLEYFNAIRGAAELRGCILTHIPVAPTQFVRYQANIHGHMHSKNMDDSRYINVSVEQIGFAPVLLNSILSDGK